MVLLMYTLLVIICRYVLRTHAGIGNFRILLVDARNFTNNYLYTGFMRVNVLR